MRKIYAIVVILSWLLALITVFIDHTMAMLFFAIPAGASIPFVIEWVRED
jgi:hypothetical protein